MSDVTAGAATRRRRASRRSAVARLLAALVSLSVVALVVRLLAAESVGFGDSEALYASYALFPQPAYLDHPGSSASSRARSGTASPRPLRPRTSSPRSP